MRLRGRIGIGLLGGGVALGLLLWAKGCDKKRLEEITSNVLKPKEHSAVIVSSDLRTVTIVKKRLGKDRKSSDVSKTIRGAREVRFSVGNDGQLTVLAKTRGFEHRLGLVGGISKRGFVGVDMGLYYWRSYDWTVGAGYEPRGRVFSLYTGIGYRLPWHLTRNTSIFAGVNTDKQIVVGLRVAL